MERRAGESETGPSASSDVNTESSDQASGHSHTVPLQNVGSAQVPGFTVTVAGTTATSTNTTGITASPNIARQGSGKHLFGCHRTRWHL